MLPDDDLEDGMLGQWVFDGKRRSFIPLPPGAEPRRACDGNVEWYREELTRVIGEARILLRGPPSERSEAERVLERVKELTAMVDAYEEEQRLQAEQGSSVVRYAKGMDEDSRDESKRDCYGNREAE